MAALTKGTGTILLIDDEEMIVDTGEELLMELGYKVLVARSGTEALDVYASKNDSIDLVIMDMIMPGMFIAGEIQSKENRVLALPSEAIITVDKEIQYVT